MPTDSDAVGPHVNVRRALPGESDELSALAVAAKSLWGYSEAQLAEWAGDLRISAGSILDEPTFVAEEDGRIVAVVQLCTRNRTWAIEHLWVHPSGTGRGVGSRLLRHALGHARDRGQSELEIDADPNAESFYLRMGARRVGEVDAPIEGQPRRVRPQMVLSTEGAARSRGE